MMTVWLVLTHGLALLIPALIGAPVLLSVTLVTAILVSLYRSYQLHARRSHPDAISRVVWEAAAECQLTWRSGKQQPAKLQPRAFVMPWLVVLHFKVPAGKSCCLALFPDMLDHEVFRRLRVRLLIELQQIGVQAT